jgi:transposase-like protein
MADLPPANTRRWVVRRKAAVVAAVENGKITLEEACRRYQLSEEEFRSWQRTYQSHGLAGLRTTRVQQYRPQSSPRPRRPRR